jgi:hypothetical protein
MKNQKWTTALLALVLPFLGACSSPATLETNTASSPKTLQAKATPNIVPNAVWDATHTFQLSAYYSNASTFTTTHNGVSISVQYNLSHQFNSEKMQFEPGKKANTLTSRAYYYVANARAKIIGTRLPDCTYSLGQQSFSVPANSFTLTFDPTRTPDPYDFQTKGIIPDDWIETQAATTIDIDSVSANLQTVCGSTRGQTTTTQTPVTLFRTAQPTNPIIWFGLIDPAWFHYTSPNLIDISFGAIPSGGFHLWR